MASSGNYTLMRMLSPSWCDISHAEEGGLSMCLSFKSKACHNMFMFYGCFILPLEPFTAKCLYKVRLSLCEGLHTKSTFQPVYVRGGDYVYVNRVCRHICAWVFQRGGGWHQNCLQGKLCWLTNLKFS